MDVVRQREFVVEYYRKRIEEFFQNGIDIVVLKGQDYAPEKVAMTEVFFTAAVLGVSAPQILWVHVRKHMSAIETYMQRGMLLSEDLRSRLADVSNYMALIDSYVADPVKWLDHLQMMVDATDFDHRSTDDVTNLIQWLRQQRLAERLKRSALSSGVGHGAHNTN